MLKRGLSLFLSIVMVICALPSVAVTAAVNTAFKETVVKTMTSGEYDGESLTISSEGSILTVNFHSVTYAYQYRIGVSPLDQSGFKKLEYVTPSYDDNGNGFTSAVDFSSLSEGAYYLQIARARTKAQSENLSEYGDGGNCYRNAYLKVDSSGNVNIINFRNVEQHNEDIRTNPALSAPEAYLDTSLSDVNLLLKDSTKTEKPLTADNRNYIKRVAERETKGCKTAYEKALAIYKYVAENTYYDVYSNKYSKDAGTNPYINIKQIEDKGTTTTVCTGYSAMMISLLRSLNVPVRLVFGHHLSVPTETWSMLNAQDVFNVDDHYWTEFYDGSEWIICDATVATSNKWNRKNKDDPGEYVGGNKTSSGKTVHAFNNYTYFHPTPQQFATTHYSHYIYSRAVISDSNDVSKLSAFLKQTDTSGVTNQKRLGSVLTGKSSYIFATEFDKACANSKTGQLDRMYLGGTASKDGKLAGPVNFSNMKGLRWLTLSYNKGLTSLNVSNDSSLISTYISYCSLESVDATGCSSLTTLNAGYNPLKSAKYTFNTSKTAKITAEDGGTFFVNYTGGKHTLTAKPNVGSYFLGWYTASGNKLSTNPEYSTTTKSSFTYVARFKKIATPKNLKITISSPTAHKISWSKVSEASGYYIYVGTSKNGKYVKSTVNGAGTTSFTRTGLTCGKTYYYYVEAYRTVSGKSFVSERTAILTKQALPPTPVVTLKAGKKSVTVSCPKISNINGYEVARSTSKNGAYKTVYTKNGNVSASKFTYTDSKLGSGKTYYYKVRAYKTVSGKKVYSSYSAVKSTKAK